MPDAIKGAPRPKWLPEGTAYGRFEPTGKCAFCDDEPYVHFAFVVWRRGTVMTWCDACSDRAKAAICGGDEC